MAKKIKKPVSQGLVKKIPVVKSVRPHKHDVETVHRTKIRMIGIGGGGGNIVAEIAQRVHRVDFIAANTDSQALRSLGKRVRSLHFGHELTNGLGCGMDAVLGEKAARGDQDKMVRATEGQDVVVLVASLGGGTGSGAAPVFAEIARQQKNLIIGIFTMPFLFEGERKLQVAKQALEQLKQYVNAYVVIPNENIFEVIDKKTSLKEALSQVNKRLAFAMEGFMETIAYPGLINVDFADVRSILEGKGRLAYINNAIAAGPTKTQAVLKDLLVNPLYDYNIQGADRILFNIAGDKGLKMHEVAEISKAIGAHNLKARIIFGVSTQPKLKDRLKITLFALGCSAEKDKGEIKQEKPKPVLVQVKKKQTSKPKKKPKPKPEPKPVEQQKVQVIKEIPQEPPKARRNAIDLKKAVDQEIQDLEEKEKAWDIPAFLRKRYE